MRKGVFSIYRMMPNILDFLVQITVFGTLQSVAVFRLCETLTDAYNTAIVSFYCYSIYMSFVLLHVRF